MNLDIEGSEKMTEKSIVEKAGEAVGYGMAMASDVADTIKTAFDAAVTTVGDALEESSLPRRPKRRPLQSRPRPGSPRRKRWQRKQWQRRLRRRLLPGSLRGKKKTPAKKAAVTKSTVKKTPAKMAAVKKTTAKKSPAKKGCLRNLQLRSPSRLLQRQRRDFGAEFLHSLMRMNSMEQVCARNGCRSSRYATEQRKALHPGQRLRGFAALAEGQTS